MGGGKGSSSPAAPQMVEVPVVVETPVVKSLPEQEIEAEASSVRDEEANALAQKKGYGGTVYTQTSSLLNSLTSSAQKNKLG